MDTILKRSIDNAIEYDEDEHLDAGILYNLNILKTFPYKHVVKFTERSGATWTPIGRVYGWRKPLYAYDKDCLEPRLKHGGVYEMIRKYISFFFRLCNHLPGENEINWEGQCENCS